MTPSEALQVFGNSIDFQYYNGTDYTSDQFLFDSTDIVYNTFGTMPDYWSDFNGATYLRYTASTSNLVANPQYITVDISPSYSIFNTDQITSLIALSSNSAFGSGVSTTFQSPSWDWVIGSQTYHFENTLTNGNIYSQLRFSIGNSYDATFVPMQWISQSLSSGYSQRAVFSGNSGSTLYLWICCPYISQDADGSQGTFTTTNQPDIDISVDIDMSETNSLLSGIQSTLSGLVSGIAGIFIPSDDDLQDWLDDMEGVYHDTFGQYAEIDELLDDVEDTLLDTSPSAVVEFPALSIPNTSLQFQARSVNLIRSEYSGILDIIKWAFDIAATCLFVNTMKKKLDEIILGKTVVELEGDD